jgi:hypothetical protein
MTIGVCVASFRFDKGLKDHSNFVNCVRYAPDGARFVSVASDKTGIVYDGLTAAVIGRLDPATSHAGAYDLSYSVHCIVCNAIL